MSIEATILAYHRCGCSMAPNGDISNTQGKVIDNLPSTFQADVEKDPECRKAIQEMLKRNVSTT